MASGYEERLGLAAGGLPEALEARLRRLDGLAAQSALGMEDLGRRASLALRQILVEGQSLESLLQRLAVSLSDQVLRQALGGATAGLAPLLPGGGLAARPFATLAQTPAAAPGASPISITVHAPGGDPRQIRQSLGQAAARLARVVEQGRRQL